MNLVERYRVTDDPQRTERRVELVLVVLLLLLLLQLLWGSFRAIFPAVPEPKQPRQESLRLNQLDGAEQLDAASHSV